MNHPVSRYALGARVRAADLVVIGRAHANMISNRPTRSVHLDAHPNLPAVGKNLVLVLVDQIGVNELQPESERVCVVLHKEHKAFAIARDRFDEHALRVNPRQPTIDRADARLAPCVECCLELLVCNLIQRAG